MMTKFNPLGVCLLALGLAFGATLSAAPNAIAAEEDTVVAIVNGDKIMASDVEDARTRLPADVQSLPMEALFPVVLNALIDTKLMAAEARKRNLDEDPEYQARLKEIAEQLLERVLIRQQLDKKLDEAALRARYEEMIGGVEAADEIRARHILVGDEAEATAIIEKLEGGADFSELAAEHSTGPSATNGGDLGYFSQGQMVKPFADAAFALNVGEFTKSPVKTQFGWHVIKQDDRRKSEPPTFEEAKESLEAELARDLATEFIEELRDQADIKRFDRSGKPQP